MKTTERLAEALRQAKAPASMIEDALSGRYDDYQSDFPTPIIDLVKACHQYGLKDIAERARHGEFDGSREEGEAWFKNEGADLLKRDDTKK